MHEDAKVALEYLYQPDPNEHPEIAITQPDAPAPMHFTAGGWFSSPIDESSLEPVSAPQ
ncbi:MAG: hypothetical protein P4N59_33075 [Negativicutes bacterium]|nr:hypothetical protein [Negativicutes bacterium]